MTTTQPRGRTEVVEALLASAQKLIAEQGPGVALRDIADDAGVNFGLIYHYLGTKEQLVREVYDRAAQSAATRLSEAEHLDEAFKLLMTFGDGTTARLVGWAALEPGGPVTAFRDSPALDVLARLLVADTNEAGGKMSLEDAKVFAALAMVIALGWRLFGGASLFAAGLDGTHPEKFDRQILGYVERFAEAATQRSRG
jgi:AcrR family transcriptional regulator